MKNIVRTLLPGVVLSFTLFSATNCFAYDQATVGAFNPGTNPVEKSATTAPNDLVTFSNAVATAFSTGIGGVFDFPALVGNPTTIFRGTYGIGDTKRLIVTPSVAMQDVTASGSFIPSSPTHATTTTTDRTSFYLAIGPILDAVTDGEIVTEFVTQIGFAVLARNVTGGYPLDVKATVSFSDGTTQSATANIGTPKGTDDTFFGFTAPPDLSITNLLLESFATGTATPVSTRICFDDFGFITSATALLPLPQIVDIYPANGAVHWATNGLSFAAHSVTNIETSGISLVLNSTDVSGSLVITGDPTNRAVSYAGLVPNEKYKMEITVSNLAGVVSTTNFFYTPETSPVTIFDSEGFTNDTLYPVGLLTAVTNADSRWVPSLEPSEVVDLADGLYGKVLRRQQLGNDQVDYLIFPLVSSGVVEIELDARVSSMDGRTIDLSLNVASANGGGAQGPFIMWGTNALNYYNRATWLSQTNIDADWHHVKLRCYVSGPLGGTFDLQVDHTSVGQGLLWRNVVSPVGTLRYGAIRGDIVQYGDLDNLVIRVTAEPLVAVPVTLLNPVLSGSNFSFSFQSRAGINHIAQYIGDITSSSWTSLVTNLGDGSVMTFTHTNVPAGPLYYRVGSRVP